MAMMAVLAVPLCVGCTSDAEQRDVVVRAFIDVDADNRWGQGDVPLCDVSVFLDDGVSAVTDAGGEAVFEAVPGGRHTVALDGAEVENLAARSLVCEAPSREITLPEDVEVTFCFAALGFLEVDVAGENVGE